MDEKTDDKVVKHNAKERHKEMAQFAYDRVEVIPYTDEFKAEVDVVMRELGLPDQQKAIEFMIDTGRISTNDPDRGGGVANVGEVRLGMEQKFGCTKKTAMQHIKRAEMFHHFPDYHPPQWGGHREGSGRPKIQKDDEVDQAAEQAADEALNDMIEENRVVQPTGSIYD